MIYASMIMVCGYVRWCVQCLLMSVVFGRHAVYKLLLLLSTAPSAARLCLCGASCRHLCSFIHRCLQVRRMPCPTLGAVQDCVSAREGAGHSRKHALNNLGINNIIPLFIACHMYSLQARPEKLWAPVQRFFVVPNILTK